MIALISRSPRRWSLAAGLFALVLLALLLAVKDLHDKLGVMTASNQGYQRMTDAQASKLKHVQSDLADKERRGEESEAHLRQMQKEVESLKKK